MTDKQLPISKKAVALAHKLESQCLAVPGKWTVELVVQTDGTFTAEIAPKAKASTTPKGK